MSTTDNTLKISLPDTEDLKPKIVVLGAGGAGGNAVNNMINGNLGGVTFWVANTDAQALDNSLTSNRIQLGIKLTKGLGAGSKPEIGKGAAEESIDTIASILEGCNMLFIVAGMGGGTGTGAAPVIARLAKDMGILTIGVVTKPFHFEGVKRMRIAEAGVEEMYKSCDTVIVIPNQNLFRSANEKTTLVDSFRMADNVPHSGVRGITDLITMPGLINLDFADIKTVMSEKGKAMMGTGEAEGEERAVEAAQNAISNPLLDNTSMKGATAVLINITGGTDMTLFEVDQAVNLIAGEVAEDANIIFGSAFNSSLEGKIRVSVVATGIELPQEQKLDGKKEAVKPQPSYQPQAVKEEAPVILNNPIRAATEVETDKQNDYSKPYEPKVFLNNNHQDLFTEDNNQAYQNKGEPDLIKDLQDVAMPFNIRPQTDLQAVNDRTSAGEVPDKKQRFTESPESIKRRQQHEERGSEEQVYNKNNTAENEDNKGGKYDIFDIPAFLRRRLK